MTSINATKNVQSFSASVALFWFSQQKVHKVKLEDGKVYVKHVGHLSLEPFPVDQKSWLACLHRHCHRRRCDSGSDYFKRLTPQKASHVKHPSVLSGVFTGRFSFDRPWALDDTGASEEDMTSWNCFGEFFLPPFQKVIAEAETDNAAVGIFPRSLCHDVGLFKWKKKDAAWLFCISATSLALVWRQTHFLLLLIDDKKKM